MYILELPPGPATISDYALVRRQFHIFERAVKKFKSDVGLWVQYIEVAKREKADALVGRIIARCVCVCVCRLVIVLKKEDRALQLHPQESGLYIMGATHELDQLSPSGARTLLQRGIRMNGDSMDMWTEYVKMEIGFIERLRRRWEVLGVEVEGVEIVERVVRSAIEGECWHQQEGCVLTVLLAIPGIKVELVRVISSYPCCERLRQRLLRAVHAVTAK